MVEPVFEVNKMLRSRPWKRYTCPEISISISDILNLITAFGGFSDVEFTSSKRSFGKEMKKENVFNLYNQ